MGLISWWAGLDWKIRILIPLILLAISTGIYFLTDYIWIWGWVAGGVLLMFRAVAKSLFRFVSFSTGKIVPSSCCWV
jgi:hypothetical protein